MFARSLDLRKSCSGQMRGLYKELKGNKADKADKKAKRAKGVQGGRIG